MKLQSYPLKRENFLAKKDLIFFFIFLFIFLFLFKNFIFTNSTFYIRDTTLVEIPARKHCAELYKEGGLPLWTDAYGNGQPFLANPKNAVFYPSTLFYLFLPFFTAFKLHYLIHVILCWIGLFHLSKSYALSQKASFLGATAFILSGMFLSSFEFYNHIAALCWMPWILLFINRPAKRIHIRIALISLFWTLMILAGTPYVVIMTILFALIQSVFSSDKKRKKAVLTFFSLFLAVLFSAAQLFPSIEMLSESDRNPQNKSMWSLNLIQLSNLVFPNILGNDRDPDVNHFWGSHLFDKQYPLYYSLYIGFGIFILFFLGLKKPWDKRHFIFGAAFFIFFILAAGKYLPFYDLIGKIPIFSALRYPVKYFMGCLFSLTMIAAIGYDRLCRLKTWGKKHAYFLISLSLSFIVLFGFFKDSLLTPLIQLFVLDNKKEVLILEGYVWHGLILLFFFSLIIFLLWLFKSKLKILGWMLILLIAADLIIVNQNINPVASTSFFDRPGFFKSEKSSVIIFRENFLPFDIKEKLQKSIQYHNYLRQSLYPFCGLGYGIKYFHNRDFYDVYNHEYHQIFNHLENAPKDELKTILEKTRCDYYVSHHPLPDLPVYTKNIEGYEFFFQKLPHKHNSAYLAYNTITADSIEKKLELYLDENFNPFETAIVENDIRIKNSHYDKTNQMTIINFKANKKEFLIKSSDQAIAVIPENYHSGWKAWIDGEKTNVFKVNLASKGILIPPGEHVVKMKYFPASFLYGVVISLLSLFLVSVFLLIRIKKRVL